MVDARRCVHTHGARVGAKEGGGAVHTNGAKARGQGHGAKGKGYGARGGAYTNVLVYPPLTQSTTW